MPQQSYSNHARFDPMFHFFLVPLNLVLLGFTLWREYRVPSLEHGMAIFAVIALILVTLKARMNALKVQDRLIRLEETLRLAALGGSTDGLSAKQCVGLRFASDAEAVTLAKRAAREQMTPQQIKQAVQIWRPDEFRV